TTLGFTLSVDNGTFTTASSTTITVNPPTGAPTASAGAPQTVASAAAVTLTGTASDPNNPPKPLTYEWLQTSSTAVTLSGASTLTATFTAPTLVVGDAAVTLGFRLTVSNGTSSTPVTTTVTVNPPIGAPTANAGAPQTVASAAS